jgi:hypothetical protein
MIRRLRASAYLRATTYMEIVTAWVLTVSSHGDHIGHPFF